MSLSSFFISRELPCLCEKIGDEPPRRRKLVRLLVAANVTVVALGVMIVIQNRGRFFTGTNERKPIANTFGVSSTLLDFPQDNLVEISSLVRPLPPPDQFSPRHPSRALYMA
ncbi:MAG: hypothetical protein WCA22_06270 [Candidatus Binatus sp.]